MILKRGSSLSPLKDRAELTKAYLAGLVDGEGTIAIHKNADSLSLLISVGMSDLAPIWCFADTYNLTIYVIGRENDKLASGKTRKPLVRAAAYGEQARQIITDLHPYLLAKQEQASLALTFPTGKMGKDTPQEIKDKREEIRTAIIKLHTR
ncbi:hypothetical protein LCGC14_1388830 [marine sediment metagenome]|uniref:Homing endonuclease LAGLIDADG domain-containing protein n=1 Tax=marine sediment metagenome TaxID=412755 RepID=A0A0F9K0Q3_9ZZZZ